MKLPTIDLAIVVAYIASVLLVGLLVKRRAAQGMEAYFLGGRQLPWWMLGMSGSASYFDITGTMWIVSLFVVLGLSGMWINFVWGILIAAFFATYMGKWIRRSRVITGAEWMIRRFGQGRAGDMARLSYTFYAILTISAFLGYTATGMGKFGVEFLPFRSEFACAVFIMIVAGIYVTLGGFRGLTIVEVFQTIILTMAAVMIAYLGYSAYSTAQWATPPPSDWLSIWPKWTLARDVAADSVFSTKDTMYYLFGAVVITYVAKGVLLMSSGPEQLYDFQKFLAAKTPREASLAGMLWGVFHTVRFPMAMGIAVMGLVGFAHDPQLVYKISADPEKVLPIVVAHSLPTGLRGLALAALTSAFIGVFGAMINGGASYLVRDVFQRYIRPSASNKELVYASYVASALFIVTGLAIAATGQSINAIFTWIMAILGAAVLVPNVLRWYWARFNGWGYFGGATAGMVLALIQVILESTKVVVLPIYVTFPVLTCASAAIAVAVALLTPPTDPETLKEFYRDVQPAGSWGSIARAVKADDPDWREEAPFRRDLVDLAIMLVWFSLLYVTPILLVTHQMLRAGACGAVLLVLTVILRFTWWPHLPKPEMQETMRPMREAGQTKMDSQ